MEDIPMMMEWFGRSWGAPLNEECPQTLVPVGKDCFWCDEKVEAGDSGVVQNVIEDNLMASRKPMHYECFIRQSVGSVGHITGRCPCYGGNENDPPGLSVRDAARAAVKAFNARYDLDG